ncbi:glycosyltransferase family 4 protein [Brachybacterium aquaticum]|uniref:Glycosyltransferase involved in cell wall biosynthesis n=1 Tax=Brachybacterium aquaticum TaxID=1432564 RepID=A0A841AFN3_9MICO|nr:glycosyltransferase family 4 protein [Brachybacterium aquaticum]MBB5832747.1 glycosyltransferase involved in cell wall biosynthesis [Brachybacterium aquaticum]
MAAPSTKTNPPRPIVVLSPMAAVEAPATAGGVLLARIVQSHRAAGSQVVVLTPSLRAALAELERTSVLVPTRFLGRPRDRRGARRLLLTAVHRAVPVLLRVDDLLPWPPLVVDLLTDRATRALLQRADVIDLQWEEYGRLAPLLRLLAPRAALVCTFHDVSSQRLEREALRADGGRAARSVRRAAARSRRTERRLGSILDQSFVLSGKDEKLLRAASPDARIRVIDPPLVDEGTPVLDASERPPVVGFVSYLRRHENRDAALRLAERIWPRVRGAVPGARLLIVGGGVEEEPARRLTAVPGVELTGFVEDLEDAYSQLRVTVSAIDRGAGVKFKVVESIIRGIPTITTSVGAEGIDPGLLTAVSDDDDALADAAIRALRDDRVARSARDAADRARGLYGIGRFDAAHQRAITEAIEHRRRTRGARLRTGRLRAGRMPRVDGPHPTEGERLR